MKVTLLTTSAEHSGEQENREHVPVQGSHGLCIYNREQENSEHVLMQALRGLCIYNDEQENHEHVPIRGLCIYRFYVLYP